MRVAIATAVALAVLPLAACSSNVERAPTEPPNRARNAVLVVIDGLDDRPATRAATPSLGRLATSGMRLQLTSAGRWAIPAIEAVLTSSTSAHDTEASRGLSPYAWTLADVMHCHGIRAAAFVANGWLSDRWGFARGWTHSVNYVLEDRRTTGAGVVTDALDWLEANGRERFFVYVHLIEPHLPSIGGPNDVGSSAWYAARAAALTSADEAAVEARYLERVGAADAALQTLLDGLSRLGHASDTLLVVTSSHAAARDGSDDETALGDGGDVPLVFRGPGAPDATVGVHVSPLDVAPTVLDAMEIELPRSFEGRGLGPAHHQVPAELRYTRPDYRHEMSREECVFIRSLGYGQSTEGCRTMRTRSEIDADLHTAEVFAALCPERAAD